MQEEKTMTAKSLSETVKGTWMNPFDARDYLTLGFILGMGFGFLFAWYLCVMGVL